MPHWPEQLILGHPHITLNCITWQKLSNQLMTQKVKHFQWRKREAWRTYQFSENCCSWTSAININKLQSHFVGRLLTNFNANRQIKRKKQNWNFNQISEQVAQKARPLYGVVSVSSFHDDDDDDDEPQNRDNYVCWYRCMCVCVCSLVWKP